MSQKTVPQPIFYTRDSTGRLLAMNEGHTALLSGIEKVGILGYDDVVSPTATVTIGSSTQHSFTGQNQILFAGTGNDTFTGDSSSFVSMGDGNDFVQNTVSVVYQAGKGNDTYIATANDPNFVPPIFADYRDIFRTSATLNFAAGSGSISKYNASNTS